MDLRHARPQRSRRCSAGGLLRVQGRTCCRSGSAERDLDARAIERILAERTGPLRFALGDTQGWFEEDEAGVASMHEKRTSLLLLQNPAALRPEDVCSLALGARLEF